MSRLLIRPPINAREVLHGYAARLAEANGQKSFGALRSPRGGFPRVPGCPWLHGFTPDAIAAFIGGNGSQLARQALKQVDKHTVSLHGLLINARMVTRSNRRICPLCLAQTELNDWTWSLRLMTACPAHAIELIDVCDACGHAIGWGRGYSACDCGHAFSLLPIRPAVEDEMVVARTVAALVADGPSPLVARDLIALDEESWRLQGSRFPNTKSLSRDHQRVRKLGAAIVSRTVSGSLGDHVEKRETRPCS